MDVQRAWAADKLPQTASSVSGWNPSEEAPRTHLSPERVFKLCAFFRADLQKDVAGIAKFMCSVSDLAEMLRSQLHVQQTLWNATRCQRAADPAAVGSVAQTTSAGVFLPSFSRAEDEWLPEKTREDVDGEFLSGSFVTLTNFLFLPLAPARRLSPRICHRGPCTARSVSFPYGASQSAPAPELLTTSY